MKTTNFYLFKKGEGKKNIVSSFSSARLFFNLRFVFKMIMYFSPKTVQAAPVKMYIQVVCLLRDVIKNIYCTFYLLSYCLFNIPNVKCIHFHRSSIYN